MAHFGNQCCKWKFIYLITGGRSEVWTKPPGLSSQREASSFSRVSGVPETLVQRPSTCGFSVLHWLVSYLDAPDNFACDLEPEAHPYVAWNCGWMDYGRCCWQMPNPGWTCWVWAVQNQRAPLEKDFGMGWPDQFSMTGSDHHIDSFSKYSEVLCLLHFLTSACLGCVDNGVVFPFQQGWRGEVSGRAPGNVPWSPQWFLSTPLSLGHGFCDVCTQRRAHIQKQEDKRAWILRYIKVYSVLSEGCVRWV